MSVLEAFCVCVCVVRGGWVGRWVRMGVGYPCPPVRNNIVTPCHLVFGHVIANLTLGFSLTRLRTEDVTLYSYNNNQSEELLLGNT